MYGSVANPSQQLPSSGLIMA